MSIRCRLLTALVATLLAARILLVVSAPEAAADRTLLSFDPGAVARITLARGPQEVVLARAPDSDDLWRVASHGDLPAREGAPAALLARLATWRSERVAGSSPDRFSDWQVTPEAAQRVRLEGADGLLLAELFVGRMTGIDRDLARDAGFNLESDQLGLFVRVAGREEVVVVNDFITDALEPRARNWFVRPLVRGEPNTVRRLVVRRDTDHLDVRLLPRPGELVGDGRPPDPTKLYAMVQNLFRLEALGPAAPRPARVSDVVVELVGGDTQAISLWSQGDRWFAATRGFEAEVSRYPAERLARADADGLSLRKVIRFGHHELHRLHWIGRDAEIAVVRDHVKLTWYATRTGSAQPLRGRPHADRDAALPLTKLIAGLEVARWDAGAAASLRDPTARVVLVHGGRERLELTLGDVVGGEQAIRLSTATVPGWIATDAVDTLRAAFDGLAPR